MRTSQNTSIVITDPTFQRIVFEIGNVLDLAQGDARIRRIKKPENCQLYEILTSPEGVVKIHGGQPGTGDSRYSAGQTSRLGIAWWTDRNGHKHVRIEADRTQASNFSVPEIFSSVEASRVVFPDDMNCCRCCDPLVLTESHWRRDQIFCCDICEQQEKYWNETGFLPPGNRKCRYK